MFKKIMSILLVSCSLAVSANASNNKGIAMKKIELKTQVGALAADLYLPDGIDNPPVVIVTGAWTTVKEQMPAVYAKALAAQGYAALTFDFRGWGQSQDSARFLEDPARKTEDIQAVIRAIPQLADVDSSRIAGVGVCASSGYMLDAALNNEQIQSVAVVAPWLHDKPMATAIYGGEESVEGLLQSAHQAADNADLVYIEAASLTNENALMYQAPYYTETDRGLIPEYDNKFNVASWDGWLNYDAQLSATKQDKPVLMVASEAMALPAGAHQYLESASDNVSAVWFEGISQFDFYDQPEAVNQAVTAIVKHFEASL